MDGLILIIVSLCLIFVALSLRSFYKYLISKERLKEEIKEKTFIYNSFEKKITRKEKMISKMLQYADDFSGIGQRINFFSENEEIKKQLMQAGFPYGLTVERFQGLKIFLLIIGVIAGGVSLVLRLPFAEVSVILLPVAAYMLTILWLKKKAKQRQAELSYQLPDFLDTMSVTLQAGVGLDQALRDIVPYFEGPVKDEFGRFIQETDVGVPRADAYRELLKRNESREFQMLIKSLIQGERLGVPISKTFKQQSEEMRKIKKEKIKEEAAKASPKVTLITTFIVMPSAIILIGGLMAINMFKDSSNLFNLFN
ncbi:type II secretion system F family protein [Cytobacillus gottheilii]|uniref:Type II secretion system F family protein n=1 Tax=Cytobacillus gottheilii TaxID=859144 RepID=A0ABX8FCB6_9BACI|nr:type II secretion system F family protein [Cytobacillus gottheilii]QVY62008.1 type II secretion system F family protein [Cytobacillus gottheilii]